MCLDIKKNSFYFSLNFWVLLLSSNFWPILTVNILYQFAGVKFFIWAQGGIAVNFMASQKLR